MKIAFLYSPVAFGVHRKPFDFSDLENHSTGLTGTDLVAVSYARELRKLGHGVHFYCHGVEQADYFQGFDGVELFPFDQWVKYSGEDYDVAVAISNPNALKDASPDTLRYCNRQVVQFGVDTFEYETHGFDSFVDLYTCPSEHAKLTVSANLPHPEKFRVLPNGCYLEQFSNPQKVAGRVIYCSSPDRGLHLLLQEWPEIRRRVPHATLEIAYQSLDSWVAFHCSPDKREGGLVDRECTRRALYVRHALRRLEGHGVTRLGGVSHRELAERLKAAEVLAYPLSPLAPTETFGCAVLEACAAGCVPVISDADCFGEVHGHAALVVKQPVIERMAEFRAKVVRALTEPNLRSEMVQRGTAHAREHAWPDLAKRLEGMLEEGVRVKKEVRQKPTFVADVVTGIRDGGALYESAAERVVNDELEALARAVSGEKRLGLKIDMVLTKYASGDEPIDPTRPFDSNSGGGCRAGFMGLAQAMARRGYDVRAFGNFAQRSGGFVIGDGSNYDGVSYYDIEQWPASPEQRCDRVRGRDAVLAYYDTSPLFGVVGPLRVASHHTFCLPFPGSVEWTDLNTAPSQYAADALKKVYDHVAPWVVVPNAVQPDLPEHKPVKGRCLYHTSPSRGLHHLLEAWPTIRENHPHATLHVVGDVRGWLAHYEGRKDRQAERADRVRAALSHLAGFDGNAGVKILGKLSRSEVLRELSEAACFPFPCDLVAPAETFSVSVMEAIAVGVDVLLTPVDALKELYASYNSDLEDLREPWEREDSSLDMAVAIKAHAGSVAKEVSSTLGWPASKDDRAHRRKVARAYTFERSAEALGKAICENIK